MWTPGPQMFVNTFPLTLARGYCKSRPVPKTSWTTFSAMTSSVGSL